MDTRERYKRKLSVKHAKLLKEFTNKILEMTHSERLKYFKSMSDVEFKFIDEIVLNFMNKNITTPPETVHEMKNIKDFMRTFIKTKGGSKRKKALLVTLKGLRMVAYILPLLNLILQNV